MFLDIIFDGIVELRGDFSQYQEVKTDDPEWDSDTMVVPRSGRPAGRINQETGRLIRERAEEFMSQGETVARSGVLDRIVSSLDHISGIDNTPTLVSCVLARQGLWDMDFGPLETTLVPDTAIPLRFFVVIQDPKGNPDREDRGAEDDEDDRMDIDDNDGPEDDMDGEDDSDDSEENTLQQLFNPPNLWLGGGLS